MAKCKRNRNRAKRNFTVKTPTANRNYKDTVFRMLFSDRKNLLSLYNAVNQSDYKNPEELEIVTLENAIYMGMKNDLAFIMDTNLYLYEHQSTYNPNMPLRDLFYICSEYQKLVDKKSLYSSTLQKIPAPNFIEFYNDKVEPEKIEIIKTAINKLDESLEEDVKIPKTSISVLCFAAYRICKDKKSFEKFTLKVSEFLATYDDNTEYRTNLMNGTNSAESVRFRLDYWRNIIRELHFSIDILLFSTLF